MSDRVTGWDCVGAVRYFFPQATMKEVDYLLWNHTGWPEFWATGNPAADIFSAMSRLKETLDSGREPCCFCNGPLENGRCGPCDKLAGMA